MYFLPLVLMIVLQIIFARCRPVECECCVFARRNLDFSSRPRFYRHVTLASIPHGAASPRRPPFPDLFVFLMDRYRPMEDLQYPDPIVFLLLSRFVLL